MKKILTTGCCIFAVLLLGGPATSHAQVLDDFSDGNDTANPTWNHLNGYVASTGQTWDASTGQYHMTAPNNGASNFGFVGSYTGPVMTDVSVSSDIVSFVDLGAPPSGPLEGGVFGVAGRLNGNNAIAGLTGYAYVYEPFADGGNGEMSLMKIGPGVAISDLGNPAGIEGVDWIRKVTLDTSKDYTFSLRIVGDQLSGEVREVGGPIVAFQNNSDSSWASGFSGYIAYSQGPSTGNPRGFPPTDVTWDNFRSGSIPEPGAGLLMALGAAILGLSRRSR
jgi:hypothetical protein